MAQRAATTSTLLECKKNLTAYGHGFASHDEAVHDTRDQNPKKRTVR